MDLVNFFHCIVLPKKSWARLVEFCYSSPLKVNFVSLKPSNQQESTYQHSKASKMGIFSNAYLICGHGDNGRVKNLPEGKVRHWQDSDQGGTPYRVEPRAAR